MSFRDEIEKILTKNDLYDARIKKYKKINGVFFGLNVFCTVFIAIVPYEWYFNDNMLAWLNSYEESISIAYIKDANINKINTIYYKNILPFMCLFISFANLAAYRVKGKEKNLEQYLLRKENNKFPETAIPVSFIVFIIWLYGTPPSYERQSLTLLNAAISTKPGFAFLNLSISFMLIGLSLGATVALYNHYFLRGKK